MQQARVTAQRTESRNHLKQLALAAANFDQPRTHDPNSGGYDDTPPAADNSAPYETSSNGAVVPTPDVRTAIPGYGVIRPRWGDPTDLPRHQLGSTFHALLPFVEQTALFQDPLRCYQQSLPLFQMPSRRWGAQISPTTDPGDGNACLKDKPSRLLQLDGRFTMMTFPFGDGVSPGPYQVTLTPEPATRIGRPELAHPEKTPWSVDVPVPGLSDHHLVVAKSPASAR